MTEHQMLSEAEEDRYLPRVIPAGWVRVFRHVPAFDCRSHASGLHGVRVLVTAGVEEDGRRWLHVSVSRPNRIPSWDDMDTVKRLFIGDERTAYEVHPPRSEHYTIPRLPDVPRAGTVLHLWSPLEGEPPLPNFLRARRGTL